MCIAILNTPKGGVIKKDALENCWYSNTDGAGLVYPHFGKLRVIKELKSFTKFYNAYLAARENCPECNIVLHFRIKTHGKCDKDNCHPFLVTKELAFVHNGIISEMPNDKDRSDTVLFNELMLKPLAEANADFIRVPVIRKLIRKYIGNSNKLIFIGSDNFAHITNEEAGLWFEENWYSNHSFKWGRYSNYKDYGGTTVSIKRTGKGAVKIKGVQAGDTYLPATKLTQLETNFGQSAPSIDTTSAVYNKSRAALTGQDCEECGGLLLDRQEQYYGFCNNCMTKYGVNNKD